MTFRVMCMSCGHTHDGDTINSGILDLKHNPQCLCFMGVGIKHKCINLAPPMGEKNPLYFPPYNDGVGFKSNERPE